MKLLTFFLMIFLTVSCASEKPQFKKENVCSYEAMRYLRNPRNKFKQRVSSPKLIRDIAATSRSMQLCYEDYKNRTGNEEFNTCLVVGVDEVGELEFYNFGSQEVTLDEQFMSCARTVTKSVPYSEYGTNYILIQSYKFYVGN